MQILDTNALFELEEVRLEGRSSAWCKDKKLLGISFRARCRFTDGDVQVALESRTKNI
uniref:AlNc14C47G3807 protein n=1 Tax=Albugo laibachii Nc14 TaxID=890382 RepID=F0WAU5_9STRA|nr:AlNc14C47G3807 [Albugo laibachii Nc14]|eukprot:CCA18267.1 AlNc14C47G3807 [Albugo laibachii Nc14]